MVVRMPLIADSYAMVAKPYFVVALGPGVDPDAAFVDEKGRGVLPMAEKPAAATKVHFVVTQLTLAPYATIAPCASVKGLIYPSNLDRNVYPNA